MILYLWRETLALYVIKLINSGFNKDQNPYYYNIFLEKCSYQVSKNNDNK